MQTKYFENTTHAPVFVGGKLIPAGAGREIAVALLPPELRDAPEPPAAATPTLPELVEEVRRLSVKAITEQLPSLSGEALDLLMELEAGQATPRKGLGDAVAAERLRRANDQLQKDADELTQEQLNALTPEQRAALGNVANP